jgi:dihydroorotate dehydrogenase (NAD+) catalytic subunit
MIELAPNHKYGCPIAVPVMPAAGAFGFGEAYHDLVELSDLGAVVTNPVSLRPRRVAHGHRIGVKGDHFVVHTGWPNPGLRRLVRQFGPTWARLPVPVIVHLLATRPAEMARAAARLSGVRNVRAIELGFTENVRANTACDLLSVAIAEGDLPVIAKLPFGRVDDLAPRLVAAGADAVTVTAPPRAVLPLPVDEPESGVARFIRGRLYGPALFPLLLHTLSRWTGKLSVPVIACGGITSAADAIACLTLGAAAVQVDALLWREPTLLGDIAHALVEPLAESLTGSAPRDAEGGLAFDEGASTKEDAE